MPDPSPKRLARAVASVLDRARSDLRALVSTNSQTSNRRGVNENGRMVARMFEPLGFSARSYRSENAAHGDHLVLSRSGTSERRVVLISHLDTVYSEAEEHEHRFAWREEGDRIHGPGVADIKGGTVLMHAALSLLAETERDAFETIGWTVLLNAAEEEGSPDFPRLARRAVGEDTDACLVYEHVTPMTRGDGIRITTSRRGSARFLIDVRGRQAHAGSAHARGASAVREAARLVEKVERMTASDGSATFNVGLFDGGTASNTVPGRARMVVDLRADDVRAYERARRRISKLAGEGSVVSRDGRYTCRVTTSAMPGYPPWPANDASRSLARLVREAAKECGFPARSEHRKGASDGCHVWDLAPTVDGLGPAGSDIHSSEHDPARGKRQESISWRSLERMTLVSARLYGKLARDA